MTIKRIILLAIVILAAALRFWKLSAYPALNADEAAIGYNAYSLLETGKDEHGNSWPIHFQSFNDFKPGLYFYLALPFVKILGLNEWAVRIPGAALGVASVFVLYLLVKELFKSERLALASSFLLAISPWHIHFSRGGWEVNVATFFITLGVWLFLKGLKDSRIMILSAVFLVASLYTYHAARIIVPLLVIGLAFIYKKEFRENFKKYLLSGIVVLVLLLPLGLDLARGEVGSRAAGVGLFADPGPIARIDEQRGEHADYLAPFPRILHNKVVNYSLEFVENYLQHFWGEFLFLTGDPIQRNRVPEMGQMYLFEIMFLAVGLIFIAIRPKDWGFILVWLLVAPAASALTFQSPHALRAQNMVVPLAVISGYGLVKTLDWIKARRGLRVLGYMAVAILIVWDFARYQHMYWLHMARAYPFSSQYGVKELVDYVQKDGNKYKKIIVTDRYDQPYILFLFYLKYPPQDFQEGHTLSARDKYGFSTVRSFGKFEFIPIDFDRVKPQNPGSLIVGTDEEIPNEANIVKRIYGSNGYLYFEAVAN
jgi:4-amino-4-deoxy-L-arabinose transferase-like glycosyltransferase